MDTFWTVVTIVSVVAIVGVVVWVLLVAPFTVPSHSAKQ
jgi:cytochrome b subunit of formate dehydrogenase